MNKRFAFLLDVYEHSNIVCENSNSYFKYCLIDSDLGSFFSQEKRLRIFAVTTTS